MTKTISVIINTLNEERNLPYALRSVASWAAEIVVVDMYSEDATVSIAEGFGARVYMHDRTSVVEGARRFAVEKARYPWVLLLDADELVPAPLSETLQELAEQDAADIVRVPKVNYFFGSPLHTMGWGPAENAHARFFKKEAMKVGIRIHASLTPLPSSRVMTLDFERSGAIIHFNYVSVSQFVEKLNRYTSVEAEQSLERGERISPGLAGFRAAKRFLNLYLRRRGFRDGWRGFYVAALMSFYSLAADAKAQELRTVGAAETIRAHYQNEAERYLRGYP